MIKVIGYETMSISPGSSLQALEKNKETIPCISQFSRTRFRRTLASLSYPLLACFRIPLRKTYKTSYLEITSLGTKAISSGDR
jgi:hypothetical protein